MRQNAERLMHMRIDRARILLLASIATVAILMACPASGWLIRLQVKSFVETIAPGRTPSPGDLAARESSVAARYPDYFSLQVAARLAAAAEFAENDGQNGIDRKTPGPDGLIDSRVHALAPLLSQFGEPVELDAHILRFLSYHDILLDRPQDEDMILSPERQHEPSGGQRKAGDAYPRRTSTRQALTLAENCALHGEALDPRNAYFPTMLAAAYLADNRDPEALAALGRAAQRTEWKDYSIHEANANTALMIAENDGEIGGIARATNQAVVLLPQISSLESTARIATALAIKRELAGDRETGFRIRKSIGRIGALMRADSQASISSYVGTDIVRDSAARPGGTSLTTSQTQGSDASDARAESQYVAYLSAIGHPDEATWFAAERSADRKMGFIVAAAENHAFGSMESVYVLALWWGAGLLFLSTFVVMTACGGIAILLHRAWRAMPNLSLDPGFGCGLVFIAVHVALLSVAGLLGETSMDSLVGQLEIFEILFLTVALFSLKRRASWSVFGANIAVFLATIGSLGALVSTAIWLGHGLATPMRLLGARGDVIPTVSGSWIEVPVWLLGFALLMIPTILVAGASIRSGVKRTPVSVGVLHAIRASAAPVAGVLLLLYVLAVCGTLVQESIVRAQIDRRTISDGVNDAAILGTRWPGLVSKDRDSK